LPSWFSQLLQSSRRLPRPTARMTNLRALTPVVCFFRSGGRVKRYTILFLIGLLIQGTPVPRARAQANAGRIDGIVSDPEGLPLPGVNLILTETLTGLARTAKTTAAGTYQFPSLSPGQYELRLEAHGFSPEVRRLTIEVDQTLRLDITPSLGKVSQPVEV